MDKSTRQIFFIFLSFLCIWIVLSEFVGDKYITLALSKIFPSMV